MFSDEEEILLEPEAKVRVDGVLKMGTKGEHLVLDLTLQKFEHLVLEDVIPVKSVASSSTFTAPKPAPQKWKSAWKECPGNVSWYRRYSVDKRNTRIAKKINDWFDDWYCTIIGNTPIPLNTVTSWSIRVLKSKNNNGNNICIGVAPSDIDQNDNSNYEKCGWYFYCYNSALISGPPHNYPGKEYGPRKEGGKYIHTGDSVGVVMDTAKGELSFALYGVNLGVAYERIPLDKPLVPCVILGWNGDSVELVI